MAAIAIQLRNFLTFVATTGLTIWALKYKSEVQYSTDNRIRNKLGILDLDIIMTHTLPFDYFKTFISDNAKDHLVYLNLYCLI